MLVQAMGDFRQGAKRKIPLATQHLIEASPQQTLKTIIQKFPPPLFGGKYAGNEGRLKTIAHFLINIIAYY